jgi:hypothetical protein
VHAGGWVGDKKGINLPNVNVSTPSLTRKDMADLQWGLDHRVDYVALSFVRKPTDVIRLRLYLEEKEHILPIIAKIEKPEAWEHLNEILAESDGVMVARGDLGVEMAFEKVPFIQKSIIERARQTGKFVITATQMLESMIESPVPTRAEVSDVANAIFDGTDAVMLSAETSAGKFPVESAATMARIAVEAEASIRHDHLRFYGPPRRPLPPPCPHLRLHPLRSRCPPVNPHLWSARHHYPHRNFHRANARHHGSHPPRAGTPQAPGHRHPRRRPTHVALRNDQHDDPPPRWRDSGLELFRC